MSEEDIRAVGFIGLGNMGGPMAINLCKAGFKVNVFARNPARLEPVVQAGAVACATIKDVAAGSDVVLTCVTDGAAVESVVFGENGVAEGAKEGSILVDCSTIAPDQTVSMADRLRDMAGMAWVDAPISGGSVGAEAGTLSVFVGANASDFEKLSSVLGALGSNITHMGPIGAGQTTKLINQIFVSCSVAMIAEAVGLAERVGLDVEAIPKALAGGRGDSVGLQNYWPRLAKKDYTALSTITSILKDLDIVRDTARAAGASLPLTSATRELYQLVGNAGFANEDLTALARVLGHPVDI